MTKEDKITRYTSNIEGLTHFVNTKLVNTVQISDDQPSAFFYSLALKTNNCLNTANLLLANISRKPHYTDSLLLLFRTMLSDAITFYYLAATSHKNNNDDYLREQITRINGDHVRFMNGNFRVYQKLYNEPDKKIGSLKKELREHYPEYFKHDGQFDKVRYPPITIVEMVIAITESGYDIAIKAVSSAFELYDTFSKYEHVGILTPFLVTRQFDESQHSKIMKEIYVAIHRIISVLGSLMLRFFTQEELDYFEKLETEIMAIKIYEHTPN